MTLTKPGDLHTEFVKAFNAGDLDALASLYEADAMLCPQPGSYVTGKDAVRATLAAFMQPGVRISMTTAYVMERGDLALFSGDFVLTGGPEEVRGRTSEVARKGADGRWRYAIDNPWSA